ncbi:MAG: M56 family peptidase [Eudoraea sp.]|nr:M56 family peptidase [Eudoraea sp.]
MDVILVYMAKASGILALFFGVYQLFLKKETFFEANRHFLLGGILVAFTVPFVEITRYVTVEPLAFANLNQLPVSASTNMADQGPDWLLLLTGIYAAGILVLSIKFAIQLLSLRRLMQRHHIRKIGAIRLVETDQDLSPFSFFNYIFYNPAQFSKSELEAIRQHEKAHCTQGHSLDMLLGHLLTITLWFNPLSWLYKRNIQQNLEFLADSSAIRQTRSIRNYQYALLKVSSNAIHTPITNNFYNSLIKKRIVMLHKSKSNQLHALKYAIILPLLAGFIFAFNTRVVAQEKEEDVEVTVKIESIEILVDKDYTKAQMDSDSDFMKERGIDLKFKGVKRNSAGEITAISASYKDDKGISGNYNQNSDEPIQPFSFRVTGEGEERSIGFFSGASLHKSHSISANKFIFKMDDDEHHKGKDKKYKVMRLHMDDDDEEHTWVEKGEGEEMEVRVEIKDGEKVITINGEEVSEEELEEFGKQADGKRIKIKKIKKGKGGNVFIMKDSDDDEDIEIIEEEGNAFFFLDSDKGEEPLFIVDGKEMSREEFKKFAPSQIATVDVLKGEAAMKKYGDRAKDGVIKVTTKKEK